MKRLRKARQSDSVSVIRSDPAPVGRQAIVQIDAIAVRPARPIRRTPSRKSQRGFEAGMIDIDNESAALQVEAE